MSNLLLLWDRHKDALEKLRKSCGSESSLSFEICECHIAVKAVTFGGNSHKFDHEIKLPIHHLKTLYDGGTSAVYAFVDDVINTHSELAEDCGFVPDGRVS